MFEDIIDHINTKNDVTKIDEILDEVESLHGKQARRHAEEYINEILKVKSIKNIKIMVYYKGE